MPTRVQRSNARPTGSTRSAGGESANPREGSGGEQARPVRAGPMVAGGESSSPRMEGSIEMVSPGRGDERFLLEQLWEKGEGDEPKK